MLVSTLALAVGLAPVAAGQDPAEGEPKVWPAVQVTRDDAPGRAHSQPQMLVHPTDEKILAIVGANYNAGECLAHISLDGGRTWDTRDAVARPPDYATCVRSDLGPFLGASFGADGTLFLVSAADDLGGQQTVNDLYAARSDDLGGSWDFSIIHEGRDDREFETVDGSTKVGGEHFSLVRMAVDPNDSSYVYAGARLGHANRTAPYGLFGDIPIRAVVATSNDGGETWSDLTDPASDMDDVYGTYVPVITVDSNGTVYAFARERTPPEDEDAPAGPESPPGAPGAGGRLLMSKSDDRGQTWTTSSIDESAVPCGRCQWIPTATADPNSDNLYVVFNQREHEDAPHDIWFTRSTDGGDTWSSLERLNDGDVDRDNYFPGVSVAPNGRIDVAWHDFRTDAEPQFNPDGDRGDEIYWDVYYTYSTDGGQTWAPNLRVSDRTMHRNEGYAVNNNYGLMGPMGIASADGAAYVAWSDSRRGSVDLPVEDYYFAPVLHTRSTVPATSGSAVFNLWSLGLGAGAGLALAGIALLIPAVRGRPRRTRIAEQA